MRGMGVLGISRAPQHADSSWSMKSVPGRPRPEPGFYVLGDAAYYVTQKRRAFLLRRAGDPSGPREVKLAPAVCRLVARQ